MSLLSAEVHAELTALLQALQSSDNATRSQAEEHLHNNWTVTRPEVLLMGLAEQIQSAGENTVRLGWYYVLISTEPSASLIRVSPSNTCPAHPVSIIRRCHISSDSL